MMSKSPLRAAAALVIALAAQGAWAQVVVVGNPAGAALTADQIAEVYLGKSTSATPLDQPESAAIRADFYKKSTKRDLAQVKATWSRLVFTGKGQAPKELPDSGAVKKAVAADPKAIGYIEKAAVDGTVKVLATFE